MEVAMIKLTQQEYAQLLWKDLYGFIKRSFYVLNPGSTFLDNRHIEAIAHALEQVYVGNIRRLIINLPPRSLKSHCASVSFPAWLLGLNPSSQIVCASYAQDLSNKLAGDCRTLMLSDFYRSVFRTRLLSKRQSKQDLVTTRQGSRLATSVGGVLTGRGGEYLIIDDPLKPDEALSDVARENANHWYDHTLRSRLNNQATGRIIVIMQRLHEHDLVGHVLEKEEGWSVLRFPAIAEEEEIYSAPTLFGGEFVYRRPLGELLHPEKDDRVTLDNIRNSIGAYNFAGQYQQSPSPLGGGMIKEAWFRTYPKLTGTERFELILQSWDTANKASDLADYSVCTTWGLRGRNIYLLHTYRKRMDYPELKRAVVEQRRAWNAQTVLIEDKASGTQLLQELRYEGTYGIVAYQGPPNCDKIMRMHANSSMIENNFVHLPENETWLSDYVHELTTFPRGRYDDQVDSTSQALDWIKQRQMGVGVHHVSISTVHI
jgi:predicted phage terminase large subunit-like protein